MKSTMLRIEFMENQVNLLESMLFNLRKELTFIKQDLIIPELPKTFPAPPPSPSPSPSPYTFSTFPTSSAFNSKSNVKSNVKSNGNTNVNTNVTTNVTTKVKDYDESTSTVPTSFENMNNLITDKYTILKKLYAPSSIDYVIQDLNGFELYFLCLKDNSDNNWVNAKRTWLNSNTEFKKIFINKANEVSKLKINLMNMKKSNGYISGYQLFCKVMLQYVDPKMIEKEKNKFSTIANFWKKLHFQEQLKWNVFSHTYNKWALKNKEN